MTDPTGPYRTAVGDACPACAMPLAPPEADRLRACPHGCGEWAAAAFVDEHWGDTVDIQHDARLQWRHSKRVLRCVACGEGMRKVVNLEWVAHRCRDHGVWFEQDGAGHFEQQEAIAIASYVAERRAVEALAASLREACVATPTAAFALAKRVLALERQVAQLQAELEALRRGRQ